METIHAVLIAASIAGPLLCLVALMHGNARARLMSEQMSRCMDACGALRGSLDTESVRRDAIMTDLSKAIVMIDRRVQKTIDDPILALDEKGKLVLYDGPDFLGGVEGPGREL